MGWMKDSKWLEGVKGPKRACIIWPISTPRFSSSAPWLFNEVILLDYSMILTDFEQGAERSRFFFSSHLLVQMEYSFLSTPIYSQSIVDNPAKRPLNYLYAKLILPGYGIYTYKL